MGWSLIGWSGLNEPVWTAFGEDSLGSVAEVRRWNTDYQQWITYVPGQPAEQLFAVLRPGDAVWVRMRIAGARWNPAGGMIEPDRAARLVEGEITYYHPSLAGGPMFCTGEGLRSAGCDGRRGGDVAVRDSTADLAGRAVRGCDRAGHRAARSQSCRPVGGGVPAAGDPS